MSALESLLGPRPGECADPSAAQPRTLIVDDRVAVHLLEDQYAETVVLYSVPGVLPNAPWLDERAEPWQHVLREPSNADAVSVVAADAATRLLFVAQVWPRAALDASAMHQALSSHAQRHRFWQQALEADARVEEGEA